MIWTVRGAATAVIILAVLVFAVAGQPANFNFVFNSSGKGVDQNLLVSGDAQQDAQGNYVSMNNLTAHQQAPPANGQCGRVVYKDKIRMVDKSSGAVASFNTSFTFSFASFDNDSTTCGSGMLFMFSANNTVSPEETSLAGGSLCELNWKNPNLRLFAVEFDSHYDVLMSDVSDSHISLDVGDKTLLSHDLCVPGNTKQTCGYFCKDANAKYSAWIDYDSGAQTLEVRFRNGSMSDGKPVDPVIRYPNLRLDEMLDDEMYAGFIASTGGAREVHTIWSWEFVSTVVIASKSGVSSGLIGGLSAAGLAGVFAAGFLLWYLGSIRQRKPKNLEVFKQLPRYSFEDASTGSRPYTYAELSDITNNFNPSELLASGGFGDVYKGSLPSGASVAVKRIKDREKGEESFLAEITSLRHTRHRNLLQLRGWSYSPDGMFLVYDFMCNSSLDKWLHPNGEISWDVRRFILAGVASGLEYLHEDVGVKCVLHRDIKSSNVMLDADFNPYLGDFGLARLVDHQRMQRTTFVAGTPGYMAPEMIETVRATKETDVYAFGILVLEVVCGRKPLILENLDSDGDVFLLVDSVWRAHETGSILTAADPRLAVDMAPGGDGSEKAMMLRLQANFLHVGLLCCHPDPSQRPSMRMVNQWFQSSEVAGGILDLPQLPASKPHYSHSLYFNSSNLATSSSLTSSYSIGRLQRAPLSTSPLNENFQSESNTSSHHV